MSWPRVVELCAEPPSNGLMEKRGGALIDYDRIALEKRMRMYYDPDISWQELRGLSTGLTQDAARFDAQKSRLKVQSAEKYNPKHLLRYALRPFDNRWCYFSDVRPLWNEPRPNSGRNVGTIINSFLPVRPGWLLLKATPSITPVY